MRGCQSTGYRYTGAMLPYRDSRLTTIGIAIFFILALGYGYFELQGILYGPTLTVPQAATTVHDPFVTITGKADRISSLSMNGAPITVTEDGSFSEPYLLTPGINRITLDAKDRYGREKQRIVTIVYAPLPGQMSAQATTSIEAASSTPAATSSASSTSQ